MIYAFGDISGAHINLTVTIGFVYAKNFLGKVPRYVISQLLGTIEAIVLWSLFPENEYLRTTLPEISPFKVFIFEFILTYILMVVISTISKGVKEIGVLAEIAIGDMVLFKTMFAGPLTETS